MAAALGHVCLLEQPLTTMMPMHPRFRDLIATGALWRVKVWLGRFGAATAKPIYLYSNVEWISELCGMYTYTDSRSIGPPTYITYLDDAGRACSDGATGLRGSQEYPPLFGYAVARLYTQYRAECRHYATLLRESQGNEPVGEALVGDDTDDWIDACLGSTIRMLMSLVEQRDS